MKIKSTNKSHINPKIKIKSKPISAIIQGPLSLSTKVKNIPLVSFSKTKNYFLKKRPSFILNQRLLKIISQSSNNIVHDGFAVNYHKPTIKEQVSQISDSSKFQKIKLFHNPFPFLYTVSRRQVLNNSSALLPGILNYSKNKIVSDDDDEILKKMVNKDYIKKKKKEMKKYRTIENDDGDSQKRIFWSDRACGSRCEISGGGRIRKSLENHDINFFNQTNYLKNYLLENYCYNSYKMKNIFKKRQFVDKIKSDVVKLRYHNCLFSYMNVGSQ